MNPYSLVGSGNGTQEAAALSARLTTWHDAMVAHERSIRAGSEESCDEECPHADARTLWAEALDVFGNRAQELTFLRSRGAVEPKVMRRAKLFVGSSERPRTASADQ